jgi:hypothetical protein
VKACDSKTIFCRVPKKKQTVYVAFSPKQQSKLILVNAQKLYSRNIFVHEFLPITALMTSFIAQSSWRASEENINSFGKSLIIKPNIAVF